MKDKSVVVNEVDRNIQMTINKAVEEFSDDVRTIDDGQTETNEMTKQNLTMKKKTTSTMFDDEKKPKLLHLLTNGSQVRGNL